MIFKEVDFVLSRKRTEQLISRISQKPRFGKLRNNNPPNHTGVIYYYKDKTVKFGTNNPEPLENHATLTKAQIVSFTKARSTLIKVRTRENSKHETITTLATNWNKQKKEVVREAKAVLRFYEQNARQRGVNFITTDWTIIPPRSAIREGFTLEKQKTNEVGTKLYKYKKKL